MGYKTETYGKTIKRIDKITDKETRNDKMIITFTDGTRLCINAEMMTGGVALLIVGAKEGWKR